MSYDHALTAMETALPEQMSGSTLPPLPRRKLGRGILTLLILLRIYVIVAIPVVGYAFVRALLATHH
jgi:hypothetical protein